jgi:hypothetical protein
MVTIYVRVPRNRWTPIGDIDLSGHAQAYWDWKGAVELYPEIEKRLEVSRRLAAKIAAYRKKHNMESNWDMGNADTRHITVLKRLEKELWEKGTYKYIRDELPSDRRKTREEQKKLQDEAAKTLMEKLRIP